MNCQDHRHLGADPQKRGQEPFAETARRVLRTEGSGPLFCGPGADPRQVARRWFLQQCGIGLGGIALGQLLAASARGDTNPLAPKAPHYAAKAKNVIFLFMAGAPSHLELFDYKPELARFNGTL